jgi:hypothetical protein
MRNKDTSTSTEALFAGCIFLFLFLFLLLISSIPSHSQSYAGTITQSGYTPPSNVWVQWCQMGNKPTCKSFMLNPSILWDGQSRQGKFGRYAGGDESVDGWSAVPAVWGEAKGGEIGAALLALYASQGLNRLYTDRELADFAFANACGAFTCGCGWFERVTGQPHPINPGCRGESTGNDSLRNCPTDQPGKGRNKNNPFIVNDPNLSSVIAVNLPCWTGSGRVGRWFIRGGEVIEPIKPIEPPIEDPVDKPIDIPPSHSEIFCFTIRIDPTTKAYTVEVCK